MQVGDKVIIKECHKMPELVGKSATITAMGEPGSAYPFAVTLDEPIQKMVKMQLPGGGMLAGQAMVAGPFGFREDELEATDKPDTTALDKMWGGG